MNTNTCFHIHSTGDYTKEVYYRIWKESKGYVHIFGGCSCVMGVAYNITPHSTKESCSHSILLPVTRNHRQFLDGHRL